MKYIISFFLVISFLICSVTNLSAQSDHSFKIIAGTNFSIDYLTRNNDNHKTTVSAGVFGQIQLNRRFSTVTTVNFSQRNHHLESTGFGFCGVGLPPSFFTFPAYEDQLQETSFSLEQLIKYHFRNRKISYFIGTGGLMKMPFKVKRKLKLRQPAGSEIPKPRPLEKTFGVQLAGGVDYFFRKNTFISTQINWNIFLRPDGEAINNYLVPHGETFNDNHLNIRVSLGHVF